MSLLSISKIFPNKEHFKPSIMIQINTHPVVKAIIQIPEHNRNQSQLNFLNVVHHRAPEVSVIDQLLQDKNTFTGLSDVKDFTRIDIDINDWIKKVRKA